MMPTSPTMPARFGRKAPLETRQAMVVTSHPLATAAAVAVLQDGGNACDAALTAAATQLRRNDREWTFADSLLSASLCRARMSRCGGMRPGCFWSTDVDSCRPDGVVPGAAQLTMLKLPCRRRVGRS
jgi:hypothetical protein